VRLASFERFLIGLPSWHTIAARILRKNLVQILWGSIRVARWYIFVPKIPIRVSWKASVQKMLVCFVDIWYIYWLLGNSVVTWYTFTTFWYVYCKKKDLATLGRISSRGYCVWSMRSPLCTFSCCSQDDTRLNIEPLRIISG
jgi:hypothetical protein